MEIVEYFLKMHLVPGRMFLQNEASVLKTKQLKIPVEN